MLHSSSVRRHPSSEVKRRDNRISIHFGDRSQYAERVFCEVLAKRGQSEKLRSPIYESPGNGAVLIEAGFDEPVLGVGSRPERHNLRKSQPRSQLHGIELGGRRIQDCGSADIQTFENRRFLFRDVLQTIECGKVRRRNHGDQGDVRGRHFAQRSDFAGLVHADLDYGIIGIFGHPSQRQRNSPMIVVALLGRVRFPLKAQRKLEHVL